MPQVTLFVSTRKGLWTLRSDDRARFRLEGPQHLGCMVHHTVLDPRDGKTVPAGVRTGCRAGLVDGEAPGDGRRRLRPALESRFRGIRFRVVDEQDRIRPHVKFFVEGEEVETIRAPVGEREVQIVAALSGG